MNTRRRLIGFVTSNKMMKTVVVEITRTFQHPLYKKVVHSSKSVKAHDDSFYDLTLFHSTLRRRGFDGSDHNITDVTIAALRATHDVDDQEFARAGVISNLNSAFLLNHGLTLPLAWSHLR